MAEIEYSSGSLICVTYSPQTENSTILFDEFIKIHPECEVKLVSGVECWYYNGEIRAYYPGKLLAISRANQPIRYYSSAYSDPDLKNCPVPIRAIADFSQPGTEHWCIQKVFSDLDLPDVNNYEAWNQLLANINQRLA